MLFVSINKARFVANNFCLLNLKSPTWTVGHISTPSPVVLTTPNAISLKNVIQLAGVLDFGIVQKFCLFCALAIYRCTRVFALHHCQGKKSKKEKRKSDCRASIFFLRKYLRFRISESCFRNSWCLVAKLVCCQLFQLGRILWLFQFSVLVIWGLWYRAVRDRPQGLLRVLFMLIRIDFPALRGGTVPLSARYGLC